MEIRSLDFVRIAQKNKWFNHSLIFGERLSDLLKVAHFWWATWAYLSWTLIFGERPVQFAHIAHFWWVTWAICSHHSLKKRDWLNCSFKKNIQKNTILVKFFVRIARFLRAKDWKEQISNLLRKNKRFAHSLNYHEWAWVNCSLLIICHERPERFTPSRSFDMSDLSDLLTVAHLSWAIWANHSQSLIWFEQSERMSEWANEQIPKPAKNEWCEQITQVAHQKWATMSDLLRLLTKNERMSEFPTLFKMEQSPLKIVIPVGTAIIKVAKVK